MSGYARETLGIKPWPGASITHLTRGYVGTAYQVGDVLVYGMIHKDARGFRFDWHTEATVDLTDPDTLAAFDRRLALRLGAPEADVRELVGFVRFGRWTVVAGIADDDGVHLWSSAPDVPPTDDPFLARVRAWRSVDHDPFRPRDTGRSA